MWNNGKKSMFRIEQRYYDDGLKTVRRIVGSLPKESDIKHRAIGFGLEFKYSDILLGYYIIPDEPDDGKDIIYNNLRLDIKASVSCHKIFPLFRHSFPASQIERGDGSEIMVYNWVHPDLLDFTFEGIITKRDILNVGIFNEKGSRLDNGAKRKYSTYTIFNKDLQKGELYEDLLQKLRMSV